MFKRGHDADEKESLPKGVPGNEVPGGFGTICALIWASGLVVRLRWRRLLSQERRTVTGMSSSGACGSGAVRSPRVPCAPPGVRTGKSINGGPLRFTALHIAQFYRSLLRPTVSSLWSGGRPATARGCLSCSSTRPRACRIVNIRSNSDASAEVGFALL